jgi:hypothetical protein
MSITPSESGEDGITPSTEGTYDVFWSTASSNSGNICCNNSTGIHLFLLLCGPPEADASTSLPGRFGK